MKGDIVLRQGSYTEVILEESGSTRLILCCDVQPEAEEPLRVRHYRVEYQDAGYTSRETSEELAEALALFYERSGGKPETDVQKHLFSKALADRIDRGLCIHCGTRDAVIRALCVRCRSLPRFQQVLAERHNQEQDHRG